MDSDEETLLLTLLLKRKLCKKKRKYGRRYWQDPLWSSGIHESDYFVLYKRVKKNDKHFFEYLRMPRKTFEELLLTIQNDLRHRDTKFRMSISPEERLVITLRYLSTGCSFKDLQYSFRRGYSTVQQIISTTCLAIIKCLGDICEPPTEETDWVNIANGFRVKANFPNCIGAIDGKHVRIIRPHESGSLYFNYKKYFSVNLLAVCNSNYEFIYYVDVGCYGKSSDSTIFANSELKKKMDEGVLNIPQPSPVTENEQPLPFVFIGDEGFPLSSYMQRPYGGKKISHKQKVYNYRLSRARRFIECSFGIMTNKWRILHRPLNVGINFSVELIKTCCILHNFVRSKTTNVICYNNMLSHGALVDNINIGSQEVTRLSKTGVTERNKFADYFISNQGEVSWQNDKIKKIYTCIIFLLT